MNRIRMIAGCLGIAALSSGCSDLPQAPLIASAAMADETSFVPDVDAHAQTIEPFLNAHCLKCHGPDTQGAGFRVDQHLPNDFLSRTVAKRWSEVLDKLNAGKMPPEAEPRPPAGEVAKVVDWISGERLRGEKARRGTEIVLRRLNRAEYANSIRELTGVDMEIADDFPADPAAGGFDNNGSVLTISPLLLDLYLKSARSVLDRAIVTAEQRPAVVKWRFEVEEAFLASKGPLGAYQPKYLQIDGQRMYLSAGCNTQRNGMVVLRQPKWNTCGTHFFGGFKVPRSGMYVIRMRAGSYVPPQDEVVRVALEKRDRQQERELKQMNGEQRRGHEFWYDNGGRDQVKAHFSERHYHYGPPRIKLTSQQSGVPRVLAEFDISAPESEPGIYEVKASFERADDGATVTFNNVYHIPRFLSNWWMQVEEDFPRPELLVDWMELEGPIYDDWPPTSHQRIFIDSPSRGQDEEEYAREVLAHFMQKAYRRPLGDGEVDAKVQLFRDARANHESLEEAIKVPLIAVLSSPHFLYLAESGGDDAKRALSGVELAWRLSYFLWSGPPDEVLARLAKQGELNDGATLIAQADRLLADPRSEEFGKNFAGQWLKLREVGVNPPEQKVFLEYDDHLETSMRGETEAFFAHILRKDLSVANFIRSDFLTINERMARFYGIDGVQGDEFRVVRVPEGMPRGGVLTQASVLAVTSNGTRTSPVWRGVWILERILGDPPAPPPPNAGDIPPKVPGIDKATVRDRLRAHRERPQCASCHNSIDPLGFALENFDGSGQWRDREASGRTSDDFNNNDRRIDAKAQLPGGAEFVGVRGLQDELLKREEQFLRCLAEKLTTYALGRELGYADEPMIADAVAHMKNNGKTLRSLIHFIVSSEAFRNK